MPKSAANRRSKAGLRGEAAVSEAAASDTAPVAAPAPSASRDSSRVTSAVLSLPARQAPTSARELALAAVARVTAAAIIPPAVYALLNPAGQVPIGATAAPAPDPKTVAQNAVHAAVRSIARTSFSSTLRADAGLPSGDGSAGAPKRAAGIAASGRREEHRDVEGMPRLHAAAASSGPFPAPAPTLLGFASRGGLSAGLVTSGGASVQLPVSGAAAGEGADAGAAPAQPPPPHAAPPASAAVERALRSAVDLSEGGLLLAPSVRGPPAAEARAARAKPTAGPQWFNMTAPEMTPELRQELLVVRHRAYLDPKQHFKTAGEDAKHGLPKVFQIGTVKEGPHEFHRARLTNREREPTLVAALLADERLRAHAKKYAGIAQAAGRAGGRSTYEARKRKAAGLPLAGEGGGGHKKGRR